MLRGGGALSGLWGLGELLGDFTEDGLLTPLRNLKFNVWEALGKSPNAGLVATGSSEHMSSSSSPLQRDSLPLLVPLGRHQWFKLSGSQSCLHIGHAQGLLQTTDAWTPPRTSKTPISGKSSVCSLCS